MRTNAVLAALMLATAVAGCVDQTDDDAAGGGGKADGNGTCDDPKYGDGTCHLDLACGIPDIDCFEVFADDDAATASAAAAGVTILPTSDPHYAKARAQLDKSWELFKAHTPLGKLADQRLALVLVNDPTVNAYVYPSMRGAGMAKFAVHIHVGMLDSAMTEDEHHGILFHELTHIQKLHTADEIYERTPRFYLAPDGEEPIGATQIDHADVREAFDAWKKAVSFAGVYTDALLANLPWGGDIEWVFSGYLNLELSRKPACSDSIQRLSRRSAEITLSYYDYALKLTPDDKTKTEALFAAVRSCIGSDTMTFATMKQQLSGQLQNMLIPQLTPEDARFDSMPALDGLLALQADRRAKLVAMENAFAVKMGRPWAALRYFSTEEEADDHSAQLTKLTGINETGVTGFLFANLADETMRCKVALEQPTAPPYGKYLIDDHHADCWRIAHARQVKAATMDRMFVPAPRATEAWVPTRVSVPRPIY